MIGPSSGRQNLRAHLLKGDKIDFSQENITSALYRPFVDKLFYFAPIVTHRRYQMPEMFPEGIVGQNKMICFCVNRKHFYVLASDRLVDLHFTGDTQCSPPLPLHRGRRARIQHHRLGPEGRQRPLPEGVRQAFRGGRRRESITAEDIFAYTYAVLHDPVYRHDYKNDLLREFPRLPLYHDFDVWRDMGRELLDLHIGFESADPYPLERADKTPPSQPSPINEEGAVAPRVMLNKQDRERGEIQIDDRDQAGRGAGVRVEVHAGQSLCFGVGAGPVQGEETSRPDYPGKVQHVQIRGLQGAVIELLRRVCTVSVKTMDVVDRYGVLGR